MPALVIDSSLAAAWCFPDERTDYSNAILQAIFGMETFTQQLRSALPLTKPDDDRLTLEHRENIPALAQRRGLHLEITRITG